MLPQQDAVLFLVKTALRKALKLIRGLRKQVSDIDEDIMAKKMLDELDISGWKIRKKPGRPCRLHLRAAGRSGAPGPVKLTDRPIPQRVPRPKRGP